MKLSLAILCVVVYCCAATPQKRCLAGPPRLDSTVDGCWPPLVSYTYNKDKKQCEEFFNCLSSGDNIFNTYKECARICMQ